MDDHHQSGGVQALHVWASDALQRAARLFKNLQGDAAPAEVYDSSVAELTALSRLLDHDPPMRSRVTLVLGSVFAVRYTQGLGTGEDRERALELLREVRDPASPTGAATTAEGRRWAAMYLLTVLVPLHEMGSMGGQVPDFSAALDWSAQHVGSEAYRATVDEARALAEEAAQLPLPTAAFEGMRQTAMMLSVLPGLRFPEDADKLMAMLPPGFAHTGRMRVLLDLMAGLLTGNGGGAATASPNSGAATAFPAEWQSDGPTSEPGAAPDPAPGPHRDAEHAPEQAVVSGADTAGRASEDPVDDVPLTMRAVFPTLFACLEAFRSGRPELVDRSLERLRAVHDQLPRDHELAGLVESFVGMLLWLGKATGGTFQDQALAKRYMQNTAEHIERFIGDFTGPSADEVRCMGRAMTLNVHVRDAEDAEDAEALRSLVDQLAALARTAPPGFARVIVHMVLGQARTGLGALVNDRDMLLDGVTLRQEALAAEGGGLVFLEELLPQLSVALDTMQAELTKDLTLIPDRAPEQSESSLSARWNSALSLVTRYRLTHAPVDLDATISELEQVRDGIGQGQSPYFAADALWELASSYQTRLQHTQDPADRDACLDTAIESLHFTVSDVVLQLGAEHGLLAARSGASRGVLTALWAASRGRVEEAVTALELGRAMVLRAASTGRAVPDLLEARGHHELAEKWRAGSGSESADELPTALPSTLRRQALEALGYRERGALFDIPVLAELADGIADAGADALVYLVPGDGGQPGMALVVGPEVGTGVGPLPLLSGTGSGPLEGYLDATAARDAVSAQSAGGSSASAERAWEESLSALCDWAFRVLSPVLMGVKDRLAAAGKPTADRPPRLVLVPCGRLGIVPWHAARLPAEDRHDYLCQAAVISYAASGSQFRRAVKRAPRDPAAAPVLVADPRLELTHAEREITALRDAYYPEARLYGEFGEPSVTPEAAGTPGELLTLLARGPSLLHVASHGSAGMQPTTSALHLAFPGRTAGLPAQEGGPGAEPDLGMLTVTRLLDGGVDERTQTEGSLVVLSACQTDLSTREHDEALTLTTAFASLGARDVVGSRWTTQDGASVLLMAVFHHYVAIEGYSPVDALRAAQLWMLDPHRGNPGSLSGELLREIGRPGLDRLSVWAAFIHQGHPGAAESGKRGTGGHQPPSA